MAEIEFDIETYEPMAVYKPTASRKQIERALEMLNTATRPLIVAGGGIINADASQLLTEFAEITGIPVIPTLMGWGTIPDDHALMAGMCSLQTSHRYGNANLLASDFVLGIGNRWANRHTGSPEVYCKGRTFIHVDIVPMKPQRVYQCLNRAFDDNDTCYVSTIGLSQIAAAQFLHVYKPRNWINCGQAGPLGWTVPAALGVRAADPKRRIVALSGDYDFQFMLEELAVGAQFKLPYLHAVVNNSYLGLIRQSQRGFTMDYCVQLGFDNINSPETEGYGVDHVKVVEGLGCKAIRVHRQEQIQPAITQAEVWMAEFQVPVVIEIMLERVTNIAMGTEIDNVVEFEELAAGRADVPTAVAMLD